MILACRSIQRGETAMEEIIKVTGVERSQMEVMELDLSSLDSIRKFVTEFKKSMLPAFTLYQEMVTYSKV